MELEVYNTNFERVAICDNYESLIWTDRYNEIGDFELYFAMDPALLDIYVPDYYLISYDSEYIMIIEDLKVQTDLEGGDHLIVTGRSLESILCRRIVWTQTTVSGSFMKAIDTILKKNVYGPKKATRVIPEFEWSEADKEATDQSIKDLVIEETQFTGDVIYDVLKTLCDQFDVGFSLKRNPETGKFMFNLYNGIDRSYDQTDRPCVVFSPDFDNLISSDYTENKSKYCNVTLVAGEGEGPDRRTLEVGDLEVSGLNRRELFTDARDLSSVIEDDEEEEEEDEPLEPGEQQEPAEQEEKHMSDKEYNELLKNRGLEKLKEVEIEKTFDGQVDGRTMYRYGRDFFMGDICQLSNQYGKEARVRVVEYIHSESTSGIEEYPTFKVLEEKEEEEG